MGEEVEGAGRVTVPMGEEEAFHGSERKGDSDGNHHAVRGATRRINRHDRSNLRVSQGEFNQLSHQQERIKCRNIGRRMDS